MTFEEWDEWDDLDKWDVWARCRKCPEEDLRRLREERRAWKASDEYQKKQPPEDRLKFKSYLVRFNGCIWHLVDFTGEYFGKLTQITAEYDETKGDYKCEIFADGQPRQVTRLTDDQLKELTVIMEGGRP